MSKIAKFNHYFCHKCGEAKKATTAATQGATITWVDATPGRFKCGQWLDQGDLKQGQGCGQVATMELVAIGGNPIIYMTVNANPVLEGLPPEVWDG
jgi:hypothetical protein